MNDGFNFVRFQRANHCVVVVQISLQKHGFGRNGGAMAFAQIIEHDCLMAVLQQLFDDGAADVTGSASDQNIHACDFSSNPQTKARMNFRTSSALGEN